MTETAKQKAVTYCMYRPKKLNGALCQNTIPINKTVCDDCAKERAAAVEEYIATSPK